MSKKIALVVDNSGSLTRAEIEKIKVTKVIPISFIINGEEYLDGVTINQEKLYLEMKLIMQKR